MLVSPFVSALQSLEAPVLFSFMYNLALAPSFRIFTDSKSLALSPYTARSGRVNVPTGSLTLYPV